MLASEVGIEKIAGPVGWGTIIKNMWSAGRKGIKATKGGLFKRLWAGAKRAYRKGSTYTRFNKAKPWIAGGALLGGGALIGRATAPSAPPPPPPGCYYYYGRLYCKQ